MVIEHTKLQDKANKIILRPTYYSIDYQKLKMSLQYYFRVHSINKLTLPYERNIN